MTIRHARTWSDQAHATPTGVALPITLYAYPDGRVVVTPPAASPHPRVARSGLEALSDLALILEQLHERAQRDAA